MADALNDETISIHALREEGDDHCSAKFFAAALFLSTLSARRATAFRVRNISMTSYFYPRSPRGGRPAEQLERTAFCMISIHALREEGDTSMSQSGRQNIISIHALREEGDSKNRDKISIFKQIIQHSARI
mgnify:CR=1 FL=1